MLKCLIRLIISKFATNSNKTQVRGKVNDRKIGQALSYFASKEADGCMNKMKAYKLLWLADRLHVRRYGRLITNDTYYAMPHGTVPSLTKSVLDGSKDSIAIQSSVQPSGDKYSFSASTELNLKVFSKSDLEVLDTICQAFGKYDQYELSELSHKFPEWSRHEKNITDPEKASSYKIFTDDFFTNVDEPSGLFVTDNEILELTKDLFNN